MGKKQEGIAMKNIQIFYKCDFKRNKDCEKTSCQKYCFHTTNPEYSVDGKRYKYNVDTGKLKDLDARQ